MKVYIVLELDPVNLRTGICNICSSRYLANCKVRKVMKHMKN